MPEVKAKLKFLNKLSKPPFLLYFVPANETVPPWVSFVSSHRKSSWCPGKDAEVFSMSLRTRSEKSACNTSRQQCDFSLCSFFLKIQSCISRNNLQPTHISHRGGITYKLRTLPWNQDEPILRNHGASLLLFSLLWINKSLHLSERKTLQWQ